VIGVAVLIIEGKLDDILALSVEVRNYDDFVTQKSQKLELALLCCRRESRVQALCRMGAHPGASWLGIDIT
jgi:hypothetical protein